MKLTSVSAMSFFNYNIHNHIILPGKVLPGIFILHEAKFTNEHLPFA